MFEILKDLDSEYFNCSTKNREKDVSFYNLPKDVNLKKGCLLNAKRENIPKTPKICHQHFEDSCFERDLEVDNIFFL